MLALATDESRRLHLFARRPEAVQLWLADNGLSEHCESSALTEFGSQDLDAIINFIGSGDPARTAAMGADIIDVTVRYDDMVMDYLRDHPRCKYLFLSSGAAYGSVFDEPVDVHSKASLPINDLGPRDWYTVAKLTAECRHRAHADHPIIDIRVFSYFSRNIDLSARYLVTDILRAIRDDESLATSPDNIVRDYIHPSDLCRLITVLLDAPPVNTVLDCYSRGPVDKLTLLASMHDEFGLKYEIASDEAGVNSTGSKPHYYSLNRRASAFGYAPTMTSLESLMTESRAVLERKPRKRSGHDAHP